MQYFLSFFFLNTLQPYSFDCIIKTFLSHDKEEQKEVDSKKVKLEKDKLQILNLRHQQYVLSENNRIIRLQQINDAAESRIKEEQRARENFIATKWHNSMTGKIDGRSWFMLSDAEQREMRKKFYSFYKPVDNN